MKKDYVQLVADVTNKEYDIVKKEMNLIRKRFGITFAEYYNNKFYQLSSNQQAIKVRVVNYKRNQRKSSFQKVISATGHDKKEVIQQLRTFNAKYGLKMSIGLYAKFEVYRYEDEKLDEFVSLYKRRNALKKQLTECFKRIDAHQMTYDEIQPVVDEFYATVGTIMPDSLKMSLKQRITASCPALCDETETINSIVVDMEATRVLLGFSIIEYLMFVFKDKTLEEKRTFLNDKERMKILKTINDVSRIDLLDDKYQAYKLLGQYYNREIVQIKSKDHYEVFEAFCRKHRTVVIKPHNYSFGKGVKPLSIDTDTDLKAVFDELISEYAEFLVEERIIAHRKIRRLNQDSVNTVRMITYFDGENSIVHGAFMKIGRAGSFVDNGGSGGIFVSIDPVTGRFISDGVDEEGKRYERHPDSGLKFKGYRLPRWKQALKLAKELASQVPGLCYIGWDLTYTKDRSWIIVEGNAKTQFVGQQGTSCKGMKNEFINLVGYNVKGTK